MTKTLDGFNPKEEEQEEKVFDLVLVDIENSTYGNITCIKKNMYDSDLKYIAVSYRWGEQEEQLVETPDYTAHITSFHINDLTLVCSSIKVDKDLKDIPYLWIDAISVEQQNHSRKKETILKMNQIYKRATYIIAVPDLHLYYLSNNPLNQETMNFLFKHRKLIYKNIFNHDDQTSTNPSIQKKTNNNNNNNNNNNHSLFQKLKSKVIKKEAEENKELRKEVEELRKEYEKLKIIIKEKDIKTEKDDIKRAYQFLAYLIEDWSNRAWVISEYQIAKEKYKQYETPLKYIFLTLLHDDDDRIPMNFFSYSFGDERLPLANANNNNKIYYRQVDDHEKFIQFLGSRFTQRSHLDMILNSNASRNEDRFNAILPTWDKYKHLIKNKNTISDWKITDMITARLKLYEIMDDLWDKARLLYACSEFNDDATILPSFSSHYYIYNLQLFEKESLVTAYKLYEQSLLHYIKGKEEEEEEEENKIKQLINDYKRYSKPIWTENLTSIQFNYYHRHYMYLSVKSNVYFIYKIKKYLLYGKKILPYLSLKDDDNCAYGVFMPFFTFTIPDYTDYPPYKGAGITLLGNIKKNRWIIFKYENFEYTFKSYHFCSDGYVFNIY